MVALRPAHWTKNAWLAAPLVFSGRFVDPSSVGWTLGATAAFCALSSGVYLLNDVHDVELDRTHPEKRLRPVAAGTLSSAAAVLGAAALLASGLGGAHLLDEATPPPSEPLAFGLGLFQWGLAYLLINVVYTLALKSLPVLDVLAIAAGFVVRLLAGSAVLGLTPSRWLLVCGFSLALLLALAKRRLELDLPSGGEDSRPVLAHYSLRGLDRLLFLSASTCLATYVLYTLSPITVEKLGSRALLWSVPPVALALARLGAVLRRPPRRELVSLLLADRWIMGCAGLWLALALWIVGHRSVS
jgi:decaprenyl-phosphate phosphoribosyltransferase